jgi:hypothetical protein
MSTETAQTEFLLQIYKQLSATITFHSPKHSNKARILCLLIKNID